MRLTPKTITHLQSHLNTIETQVLQYRANSQQNNPIEEVIKELDIIYTTDKPDIPISSFVDDKLCESHIVKVYIPSISAIHNINKVLFLQSVVVLRQELPIIPEMFNPTEDYYDSAASRLLSVFMQNYYALLIYMGTEKREQAFQIVINQLDKSLNPEGFFEYSGTYLYNIEATPSLTTPMELGDGIELRLTTCEDIARELHISNLFDYELNSRKFLPPHYSITVRDSIPLYNSILNAARYISSDRIDNVICALRLHQPNYVGRDRVYGWMTGFFPFFLSGGNIPDATAQEFATGMSFREEEPLYQLDLTALDAIKKTLKAIETNKDKLEIAITRFNDSYSRLDQKERIIDLVIALENLFGRETEKTKEVSKWYIITLKKLFYGETTEEIKGVGSRIRKGTSQYLGESSKEKKAIRDFINSVYDLRSKIVHGDSIDNAVILKKMTMKAIADKTEEYVRKALRKMLQNPSEIGQEYQNDLLLGD